MRINHSNSILLNGIILNISANAMVKLIPYKLIRIAVGKIAENLKLNKDLILTWLH